MTGAMATWVPRPDVRGVFLKSAVLCLHNTMTIICMKQMIQQQKGLVDKDTVHKGIAIELARRAIAVLAPNHVALLGHGFLRGCLAHPFVSCFCPVAP